MAPRRSRISPALMEKLQVMKYAFRKDKTLNFTQGMSWDEELAEIEELQRNAVPREIYSYTACLAIDDGDDNWEDEEEQEEEEEDEDEDDIYMMEI
jgi:hypothetical protein